MDNTINLNIESKSFSKAATKLIDAVSGAIGRCNDTDYIERIAEAKANAMIIKAESKDLKKTG